MSTAGRDGVRASGQCKAISNSELIIATDASLKSGNAHGGAFIATTGRWGLIAARYRPDKCRPNCVDAMELRAVWYGLKAHKEPANDGESVTFRIDSLTAVRYLQRWQQGNSAQPNWYDTSRRGYNHPEGKPTLVALQEEVTAHADNLHFEHVKGHAGDILNEAADSLAGIGTNCLVGVYDTEEAKRRSASLAASFLLSYQQAQTAQ